MLTHSTASPSSLLLVFRLFQHLSPALDSTETFLLTCALASTMEDLLSQDFTSSADGKDVRMWRAGVRRRGGQGKPGSHRVHMKATLWPSDLQSCETVNTHRLSPQPVAHCFGSRSRPRPGCVSHTELGLSGSREAQAAEQRGRCL